MEMFLQALTNMEVSLSLASLARILIMLRNQHAESMMVLIVRRNFVCRWLFKAVKVRNQDIYPNKPISLNVSQSVEQ